MDFLGWLQIGLNALQVVLMAGVVWMVYGLHKDAKKRGDGE